MNAETSFGRWLQRRRKALDLTQEQLAQRVGCAAETLRKIEADARRPSKQIAERLADALELQQAQKAAFIQAARAELAVDRLVSPMHEVTPPALLSAATLPSGTVTFLFTDIEGSTQLWEQYPQVMADALARHDAILRQVITAHGGVVFKSTGDGLAAAFPRAADALGAALTAQRALHAEEWGVPDSLRVRMALHTGAAEARDGDYFGPALNRVARLLATGHGGQVLLSLATAELVRDALAPEVTLRELGAHRLKDLTHPEHIFQVVASDLPSAFPPLRTLDALRTNLPAQPTALIGRDTEVARVCALLQRPNLRLITLTGPGGVGKTRLALQVAAELIESFPSGVYFVPLEPIRDPALVPATIAQALGVKETTDRSVIDGLRGYLRDKPLLLVLDNFEQVVAAAPLIGELLAAAPWLKVLVTSREVLRLRGETEFAVPPLALPHRKRLLALETFSQYAAVELFIARAIDAKPDFGVTNDNAPAVAAICHRLDGLPLAIELAAARLKLFAPQALLARLEQRLALLTGGPRDLPARQQTLRNTIEWSYNLLDAGEQVLFRRLAVFAGGCTIDAAEAVCTAPHPLGMDTLDGLAALVDKSLVRQTEGRNGEPRFVLLETVREYALKQLTESSEADALRHQHATYYLVLAEMAAPELSGAHPAPWLDRLETEHDNLRAALTWALEGGDVEVGIRFAAALAGFWVVHGHVSEGHKWLKAALARSVSVLSTTRATILLATGRYYYLQGNYEQAISLCQEALTLYQHMNDTRKSSRTLVDLARILLAQRDYSQAMAFLEKSLSLCREHGDELGGAWALSQMGEVAYEQGDDVRATALYKEALVVFREQGPKWNGAFVLTRLGDIAYKQGHYERATALYQEALAIHREADHKHGIPWVLSNLGAVAYVQGDYDRAELLFKETLLLRHEVDDQSGIASALTRLGYVALGRGDRDKAAAHFYESLALAQDLGQPQDIVLGLAGLAAVAGAAGRQERAARLFGAVEELRRTIGYQLEAADRADHDRSIAAVHAQLDEATFAAAWAEGQAMSLEQAIGYALEATVSPPEG